MSVPKYQRTESKTEYLNNYWQLRRITNNLIGRDFGLKTKTYTLNFIGEIYDINEEYSTPYTIPYSGSGTMVSGSLNGMFYLTGGPFTDYPSINTTYYTSNTIV